MASGKRLGGGSLDRSGIAKQTAAMMEAYSETFQTRDGRSLGEYRTVEPIRIDQIAPDPQQPRRIIPSELRVWIPDLLSASDTFFHYWMDAAAMESTGSHVNETWDEWMADLLNGDPEEKWARPEKMGPINAALYKVIDLAVNIQREGLVNPITVVRDEERYRIETGERRWLAYHLLANFIGMEWTTIPAYVEASGNIWRQASENNARDDLNAIAKARQFAILLMDLIRQETGVQFQPLETFENELAFYAQVADGERWRIPRGKGELLRVGLGVKNERQVKTIRAVLRLPFEVWVVADDLDWTLGKVTPLTALPRDECLAMAAKMAQNDGYMGKIFPVSSESTPKQVGRFDRWREREYPKFAAKVLRFKGAQRQFIIQSLEQLLDELRGE